MKFEIHGELVGEIWGVETIASGEGIHILQRLIRLYGDGNRRKLKGSTGLKLAVSAGAA